MNLREMPSPQDYLNDAELDRAVLEASRLAWTVHEYDRDQVCRAIAHIEGTGKLRPVLVALAAMVDVDRPLSELLAWVYRRVEEDQRAAERKPWEREAGYPPCDPADDESPPGCGSRHGTPARRTAGCRGEGCRLARSDYDAWRYRRRDPDHTPEPLTE